MAAETRLFTRTGEQIAVRDATAGDRSALAGFLRGLAPEDLRYRFGGEAGHVDAPSLNELCRAASPTGRTLLALHGDTPVAIATLAGPVDGTVEVRLSTLPEWKRHGVSWTLLDHAIRLAHDRGARQVVCYERHGNHDALQLEHDMGFSVRLLDAGAGELMAIKSV